MQLAAVLLMLMGTQWYVLFNVIAGATAIPQDLQYTARLLQLSRWERWRTLILPALFPYLITGAVTASGGAWNASIVAEYFDFGGTPRSVTGVGAQLKPYAAIVEPETGKVDLPPHSAISYAACAAEVEVDDETGEVVVKRLYQCFDVGRAINPTLVEGQIEGGALMGLGLGVIEQCYPYYPSVEHRGGEFGSYLAPGIENLPQIDTIIIENPSESGPYGAKGISEMANNPQPPAIAAAVYDAVGVWVTELPITPERVLRALQARAE